ncbi:MAG: lipopolysaccharide biosynthesis protein [Azoarcus sp.]|jgi:PST family polysaccharide transporter|nr:lipopolysaccharide biosynthesis protein [Azoarcus sp.]
MNRHEPRHALVRQALVLDAANLTRRVVSGAGFTFLGIALRTAITLVSVAILARLLNPADFGYIAMATVVTDFAALLGSFGLTNILIQRRRVTRLQLDTVFWAGMGIGLTLAALVFALSFVAGRMFGDDGRIGELLRVLCLNFIFTAWTTVHEALLGRLMRFRTDFVIQTTAIALRTTVAVLCALAGFGVWSLVAGSLSGSLAVAALMSWRVPYLPRLRFHADFLRASMKTGSGYMGNMALFYVNMNLDLFLIGRRFGADALGYYQNARSLTDEVVGRLVMPLQRVLFPALSSMQHDLPRLRNSVLKSSGLLAALMCPVGFGIAAAAPEIVPALYGGKWLAMIPVLAMLGVRTALRSCGAIATTLFYSQDKVALSFRYRVIEMVLLAVSVVAALPYGLTVTAAVIAANSLFAVFMLLMGLKLIGLGGRDLIRLLACPLVASLVMWGALVGLRAALPADGLNALTRLLATVACGALVYGATLTLLSRQYWRDFADLLHRLAKRD